MIDLLPAGREAREESILRLRPSRNAVDPFRPYGFFVEEEPRADCGTDRVATIFLTNRECPWRCLMCDLWKNTLESPTPKGAIPAQIRYALERLPSANVLKLYNAGSFFDRAAIPCEDHGEIASLARGFERVVVECHPALVGDDCLRFRDLLGSSQLQVALGLETANAEILRRLNKRMTLADFGTAASFLLRNRISLRVFVLVGLPFLRREEWAGATRASVELSFRAGAEVVSLIPTRLGNGAMEELQRRGEFEPPLLSDLETAMGDFLEGEEGNSPAVGSAHRETAMGNLLEGKERKTRSASVVLADLWNADALAAPACCGVARIERLRSMNLLQRSLPPPPCPSCLGLSRTGA
ncbi:MAG TPA: radical SAM protein [Thermoanaerobaculia bacterium]|nr:radical SAM protein [Thermoanaerobaculia bacterium]